MKLLQKSLDTNVKIGRNFITNENGGTNCGKKRVLFKLSGEKKYNCLKNRKNKSKRLNEAKCALSNIAKGKRNTITDEEFKIFFKLFLTYFFLSYIKNIL